MLILFIKKVRVISTKLLTGQNPEENKGYAKNKDIYKFGPVHLFLLIKIARIRNMLKTMQYYVPAL